MVDEMEVLGGAGLRKSGRWALLCSIENCPPCAGLTTAVENSCLHYNIEISKLYRKDIETVRRHRSLGIQHYPTVILMEDTHEVARIEGRIVIEGEVDLSEIHEFFDSNNQAQVAS